MDQARPIQVITTGEDHTFLLEEDALTDILLQEDIKDRFVVVVSVAGAFRKGKSFLLDFFLRYMYSTYVQQTRTKDWLGGDTDPLKGFCQSSVKFGICCYCQTRMWHQEARNSTKAGLYVSSDQSQSTVLCEQLQMLQIILLNVLGQIEDLHRGYHGAESKYCGTIAHRALTVKCTLCIQEDYGNFLPIGKESLQELIPQILAPENLVVKEINGQKVRARELIQYFISYMNIYKGSELPEPKSMLVATAEANNLTAVAEAKDLYVNLMEDLKREIRKIKLNCFSRPRGRWVVKKFSEKYREKLDSDLEEAFGNFRAHNESKNIFKAARTPAVYFAIAVVMYILSGIFGLFGLYVFANSANLIMGAALLTLAMWAYIRYSGELSDFGSKLDVLADFLWENVSFTI
uniref:Uncharacterized protein n=1 Tax=Phlebotomus papatasi TaxID=29031 RepID=A0A1B0D1J0_PHLPP